MCHAALNCAVRYCIVDQAVLGVRILTELIWILSSFSSVSLSSFEELLSLSYAFRQLKLKIQISSVRI